MCRWLVVSTETKTGMQTEVVAAVEELETAQFTDITTSSNIYTPDAFNAVKSNIPSKLLRLACGVWEHLNFLEVPVNLGLLKALGVKDKLDEATFKVTIFRLYHLLLLLRRYRKKSQNCLP